MNVSITIPENIADHIKEKGDIPRLVKEALTIEAYRNGIITESEVQELLEFSSRFEVDAFLKKVKAYIDYTVEDLQADIESIQKVIS